MTLPLSDDGRARPTMLGNRYEVGRLLGRGGMAEVYQGRDVLLDRPVAVKLLGWAASDGDERAQRLLREARAAASLSHPHVVAVHDIGMSPSAVFVVMEYLEGQTLGELLAREHHVSALRAVTIGTQVCSALEAAHQYGVVHRDVTPANIMICRDGTVKMMDFGIAKFAEDATVTSTGLMLGTPAYISPEQVQSAAVDERADIYALGCCLFHLLTGRPPFVGNDPVAVAYQHVNESPPSPDSVASDVSPELAAVVMRAIEKRPEDRYQNAAALLSALEQDTVGATKQPAGGITTPTLPTPPKRDHDQDQDQDRIDTIARPADGDLADPETGTLRHRIGVVMIVGASAAILAVAAFLLYQALTGT